MPYIMQFHPSQGRVQTKKLVIELDLLDETEMPERSRRRAWRKPLANDSTKDGTELGNMPESLFRGIWLYPITLGAPQNA